MGATDMTEERARSRKRILGVLLVVVVAAAALEYTVGGGWKVVQRELRRRRAEKEIGPGMSGGKKFFDLPSAMGPENARIKVVIFLNPYNHCHADFATGWQTAFKPYADKVRVVFKDITAKESAKILEGYAIGCEAIMLINGLPRIKVPWSDEPVVLEGAGFGGPSAGSFDRIMKWLLSEEGYSELKRQRKEFEKERQERAKKEAELRQKQQKTQPGAKPGAPARPRAGATLPESR